MEVIIWKLCTSKALGSRQRTVMLWQGTDWLASDVHFMPFFLQENPVLSVLSWQHYRSCHRRASLQFPGTPGSELGVRAAVWVEKGDKTRACPVLGGGNTGTTSSPSLPGAVGFPTPCTLSTEVPGLYATCCMGGGDDRSMGTSI